MLDLDSEITLGVPKFPLAGLEKALDEVCVQLGGLVGPVLFEDMFLGIDFGALGNPDVPLGVTAGEDEAYFFVGAEKGLEVDWEVADCEGGNAPPTPFDFGTANGVDGAPNTLVGGLRPGNAASPSLFGGNGLEVEGAPNILLAGLDVEEPGAAPLALGAVDAKGFGRDVEGLPKILPIGFESGEGVAMPFGSTPKGFKLVVEGAPKPPVMDETPPKGFDEVFVEGAPKTLVDDPLVWALDGAPKTLDGLEVDFAPKTPFECSAD